MNFLVILSTVLLLTTGAFGLNNPSATPPNLCVFQGKLNQAIGAFSPSGQASAKSILVDVQHEVGKLLQSTFTQIKAQNNATLIKLANAEGPKFQTFLNAIGFNNATAFSGDLIDLCVIQKDGLDTLATFSNKTQATIKAIGKLYMEKAKPQLNSLTNSIMSRNQNAIMQLYKTEKMEKLMALANLLQSFMSITQ